MQQLLGSSLSHNNQHLGVGVQHCLYSGLPAAASRQLHEPATGLSLKSSGVLNAVDVDVNFNVNVNINVNVNVNVNVYADVSFQSTLSFLRVETSRHI